MRFVTLLALVSTAAYGFAMDEIDAIRLAKQAFTEAKTASDDDGGRLWGVPVYGPTLLIDADTRFVVANVQDPAGLLQPRDGVFVGMVGAEFPVANTSHPLGGLSFTVVPLQNLGDSLVARRSLLSHEAFHRIQAEIGLPAASVSNSHLDTKQGRIWIQLEWRALAVALVSWGDERTEAIQDALTFRAYRQSLFEHAKREEDRMEVHEGLAEYTGLSLSGLDAQAARWHLAGRLKVNALRPTYPMSFAYETGPAYGFLLDMEGTSWRENLSTESSLADLMAKAMGLSIQAEKAATRANLYNAAEVFIVEEKRENERVARISQWKATLIEGPVMKLPLLQSNFVFNPNEVVPIEGHGNVYPAATVSAEWGTITIRRGLLIASTWQTATVTAPPNADTFETADWTLQLKPGWRVVPGERPGDFTLKRG